MLSSPQAPSASSPRGNSSCWAAEYTANGGNATDRITRYRVARSEQDLRSGSQLNRRIESHCKFTSHSGMSSIERFPASANVMPANRKGGATPTALEAVGAGVPTERDLPRAQVTTATPNFAAEEPSTAHQPIDWTPDDAIQCFA